MKTVTVMGFSDVCRVIASAAKQSMARHMRMDGLLRFARNDVGGDNTRLPDVDASAIIEL